MKVCQVLLRHRTLGMLDAGPRTRLETPACEKGMDGRETVSARGRACGDSVCALEPGALRKLRCRGTRLIRKLSGVMCCGHHAFEQGV
jgi:hypothetical protein